MTNKNTSHAVKVCWSKIKLSEGSEFFVERFYQLMFEQHPELRPLFPETMRQQNAALLSMLDNVINGLEFIDELEETLIKLGKRHQKIGIQAEMYDVFVDTVVESAKQSSNNTLTENEIISWKSAFREMSDIMIKGY